MWSSLWGEQSHTAMETALVSARAGKTGKFGGLRSMGDTAPRWWDAWVRPILRRWTGACARWWRVSRDMTASREADALSRQAASALAVAAEANAKLRAFFEQGANFAALMRSDGDVHRGQSRGHRAGRLRTWRHHRRANSGSADGGTVRREVSERVEGRPGPGGLRRALPGRAVLFQGRWRRTDRRPDPGAGVEMPTASRCSSRRPEPISPSASWPPRSCARSAPIFPKPTAARPNSWSRWRTSCATRWRPFPTVSTPCACRADRPDGRRTDAGDDGAPGGPAVAPGR